MLRAASRRVSRDTLPQCIRPSEPLYLSWLCPSQQRYLQRSVRSPMSLFASRTTLPTASYREYATAVEQPLPPLPDKILDYAGASFQESPYSPSTAGEPKVVIYDTPYFRKKARFQRMNLLAVPREQNDLMATFYACIKGGRVSRAQLMLAQITTYLAKDSQILIDAHNTFLQAMLDLMTTDDDLRIFFVWYEEKVKKAFQVPADSTTVALLLKASLKWENPVVSKSYVNQYVNVWKEAGGDIGEVLAMPILSDDDVVKIAEISNLKVNELHPKQKLLVDSNSEAVINKTPKILSIPEVVATDVKGASLTSVKQSLRSLIDADYIPAEPITGADDIEFQIERQKLLEEDAFESAQARWRRDHEALASKGIVSMSATVNSLLWEWHQALVPLIQEELNRIQEAEENPKAEEFLGLDRCLYGPFLRLLPPEKLAAITILELIRLQNALGMSEGTKSSRTVTQLGNLLEQEYLAEEIKNRKNRNALGLSPKEDLTGLFQDRGAFSMKIRSIRNKIVQEPCSTAGLLLEWPARAKAKIGAVLISMLIHCAKIPVTRAKVDTGEDVTGNHPALFHTYEYIKGKKVGVLKFHPDIVKRFSSEPLRKGMLGRLLPMVVVPRPWTSWDDGGYYYAVNRVVRTKSSREQEIYVRTASERGNLEQIFKGLDVLGRTAWRINKPVFDVVLAVWNKGEAFAEIPAASQDLELPPEPPTSADPRTRYKWIEKVKELTAERKSNHSQRCDINFKVEIARAFLFEKFYFPHNVDFRGRAYPIPPNLNHIGNDLSRGLLMFGEAKEIGASGLKWLKIHCANLAGFDKASFSERERFVDEHLDDIFDSANNPLDGKRWWLQSEDAWQTLAACFALRDAYALSDPTKYECRLPVAQDGTCNGLQHYAALGGDPMGAKQVNLEPSDKPQDVYQGVADLVKIAVNEEAAEGNADAMVLKDFITRKVVKQPVMTNVYGVTFMGARSQIQSQLKDIPSIPQEKRNVYAMYLAKKVFKTLGTMFTGAEKIQDWLAISASMITRSLAPSQCERFVANPNEGEIEFMTSVVWTTPLGLPVVQPYREEKATLVRTNLQNIYISDPTIIDQVNSRKQMTAFPPNFIHSLDATHMLMSAIACAEHGLTFASVHDSFWTHPSDVDTLNRILRDAFITLHSEGVMANLLAEFNIRYKGYKYLAKISGNSEVATRIRAARKKRAAMIEPGRKTTLTFTEDLLWELERDRLLASDNPEEREIGMKTVTPSVLLESAQGSVVLEERPRGMAKLGKDIKETKRVKNTNVFDENGEDEDDEVEVGIQEEIEELDKPRKRSNYMYVWVPLKFPPLPERGEFQVERLKDSKYFFS